MRNEYKTFINLITSATGLPRKMKSRQLITSLSRLNPHTGNIYMREIRVHA